MPTRRLMCVHHVYQDAECDRCDRLIRAGKLADRLLYTQQRVWQLEMKAQGRCEICGRVKGKCPSKSRCRWCLNRDTERHRRKNGTRNRRWMPGMVGRPRYIGGAEENFRRQKEARKESERV